MSPRRFDYFYDNEYGFPVRSSPLPADGIKAKSARGQKFVDSWWAAKWIAALERIVDTNRLKRGRSYARKGQVLSIDYSSNQVRSKVQGSRPSPYKVRIVVKPISDADWNKALDAMASQAIFSAKLLAGEMPQDIEEAFSSTGTSLFPTHKSDLVTECSCPDWANPCKHVSAVYYLLGEQFDADPFLLFQLRGRSKEAVLEELRSRRGVTLEEEYAESVETTTANQPEPQSDGPTLEESLDSFWIANLSGINIRIEPAEIDAAPIKRLGEPTFWKAKGEFISVMASAYCTVADAALKITDASQQED